MFQNVLNNKNKKNDPLERLVDAWGSMSAIFGFSRSTGRVSALLMATGKPWSLTEIAERLQISRGNASMCLKELRAWGVARRTSQAGDRQDYFVSDGDLWRMTVAIARDRKRGEWDPAAAEARAALADFKDGESAERAAELSSYLDSVDSLADNLLENETALLGMIQLLQGDKK